MWKSEIVMELCKGTDLNGYKSYRRGKSISGWIRYCQRKRHKKSFRTKRQERSIARTRNLNLNLPTMSDQTDTYQFLRRIIVLRYALRCCRSPTTSLAIAKTRFTRIFRYLRPLEVLERQGSLFANLSTADVRSAISHGIEDNLPVEKRRSSRPTHADI